MKKPILLFITFFYSCILNAQNNKIDSLMSILRTAKADTFKVNMLNWLAYEFRENNSDTAIYFATEAMLLANSINYNIGIADAYRRMGTANINIRKYAEALKNNNNALNLYEQLLVSSKQKTDKLRVLNKKADVYNNLGRIYENQGNYPEALKNHFLSLKICEETKNLTGMASCYNYIGIIYWDLDNYSESLKNQLTSLQIREKTDDKDGIAASYNNIGLIHYSQGQYLKAMKYYLASIKISEQIGNIKRICISYENMGAVNYDLVYISEALKYYFGALKINEKIKDKEGLALTYLNIGDIYAKQGKKNEAYQYLNKGLSISIEIGSVNIIAESYRSLVYLDSVQGNFEPAFEQYKLFITYRDSLYNEENTKKIVQTQMQYDFDKKEAATRAEQEKMNILSKAELQKEKLIRNSIAGGTSIIILSSIFSFIFYKRKRDAAFKQKEAEIKQKEAEFGLQVSETEMKALRAQMNPHFIFNSLNSIDDYVQHHDIDNSSLYINKFARLMRKILENSRLEQVPLHDDIEVLELYIQMENLRMKKKVAYSVNISQEVNAEQVLIQPLLLQPFVENAFKHAFVGIEKPTLEINITQKGDMIHCEVKDNGKGRGSKQEVVLETKEHRESLGLKVTQERLNIFNKIKKTKAYIAFEDMKDANLNAIGTRVEVAVPVSYAF